MVYQELTLEIEDAVAVITLNRPERLNALNLLMRQELEQALQQVKDNEAVRVLVLTGKGRAFCAGADLTVLQQSLSDEPKLRGLMDMATRRVLSITGLGKPTIAAINGVAAGGGLAIAACCDIRLAATSAKFGATFVKRGLMPDNGLTYTLTKIVGPEAACRLMLTGDVINSTEAERIRLVSAVVADGELMTAAMELAKRIAANAPVAVKHTREAIYRTLEGDLRGQLDFEAERQMVVFKTKDVREGVTSFLEKREPKFNGN